MTHTPPAGRDREVELVIACHKGRRSAFHELVRLHRRHVARCALAQLRDPERAFDLAEEAFAAAWKGIRHIPADRPLRPWLAHIVRRLAAGRAAPAAGAAERAALAAMPAAPAEMDARRRLEAFDRLPAEEREVLLARTIEGRAPIEIAAAFAVTEDEVNARLAAARVHLRARTGSPMGGAP